MDPLSATSTPGSKRRSDTDSAEHRIVVQVHRDGGAQSGDRETVWNGRRAERLRRRPEETGCDKQRRDGQCAAVLNESGDDGERGERERDHCGRHR